MTTGRLWIINTNTRRPLQADLVRYNKNTPNAIWSNINKAPCEHLIDVVPFTGNLKVGAVLPTFLHVITKNVGLG